VIEVQGLLNELKARPIVEASPSSRSVASTPSFASTSIANTPKLSKASTLPLEDEEPEEEAVKYIFRL
jgi:hypothetical protein